MKPIDVVTDENRVVGVLILFVFFVVGFILSQLVFNPGPNVDFASTSIAYKISSFIMGICLVSLGLYFVGLLFGIIYFRYEITREIERNKFKFNIIEMGFELLILLAISSIFIGYVAFGWIGSVIGFLLFFIPFIIIIKTKPLSELPMKDKDSKSEEEINPK